MTQKLNLIDQMEFSNRRHHVTNAIARLKGDLLRIRREQHLIFKELEMQVTTDLKFIDNELQGIKRLVSKLDLRDFGIEDEDQSYIAEGLEEELQEIERSLSPVTEN